MDINAIIEALKEILTAVVEYFKQFALDLFSEETGYVAE